MDLQDAQNWLNEVLNEVSIQFQKMPGSAIFLRYVKSSYQNDPVRSAVELFLFLFAVRYLLAPKYSTQRKSYVTLSEEVCPPSAVGFVNLMCQQEIDELVDEWTPEPLVAPQTSFEEAENEKRPVIVGWEFTILAGGSLHHQADPSQAYRTQIEAFFQRADSYKPCVVQFLQFGGERDAQRESDPNVANIWCGSLRPTWLLWNAGCTYEDGGRYCILPRCAGLYCVCAGLLYYLKRNSSLFQTGRCNHCG